MIITNIINKIKMINFLKIFIILIFTSSILGCTNNQIEKNVFSPDKINLKVLNSDKKSLKEYEFYIINFWASWCVPCKNEVPILNRLNTENKNLKVIGISIMDVYSESLNFIKSNNVQYKNYWDENLVSLKSLNSINSIPVTLIFNDQNQIIQRVDGELDQESYFKILGIVKALENYGANDCLVVKPFNDSIDNKTRLIPYINEIFIKSVDIKQNIIKVNWRSDY